MIWILIFLCFVILIAAALYSRIYVTFNYSYTREKHILSVTIAIYKLKVFRKQINLSEELNDSLNNKQQPDFGSFQEKLKSIFQQLKSLNDAANQVLGYLQIQQLNWHTNGGTGDAASTGIASGGVWMIKGIITGVLAEKMMMKCKPGLTVQPHFQLLFFQTKIDCIVSFRLGQTIYALFKVMRKNNLKEKAYI
ncbi:hypothetical protein CIL03_00785 [Virgibacillus indicus]|uniref:DUF2953 domain-containing protein n=1 Tax=Virgibacillus indicus TaxID=2024554 RepID=A0A265NE37_9BACI|nr:DUF2953 domain-containing protein [Virgibacillus indicus]OZU89709.1 hypothetical protein CIL03_00785 [Virgibacillus indicus]